MLCLTIQNRFQDGTSKVSEAAGARWRFSGRMWSDCRQIIVEIVFLLAEAFRELPPKSGASRFRGRRTIWWGCRVTLLAPRIGNDVSYVTQIIDDIHFAWQAQYLVKLDGDSCCAAHFKWRFKVVPVGVVRSSTGVVQSSTAVVLCSIQSSTGVELCSTE